MFLLEIVFNIALSGFITFEIIVEQPYMLLTKGIIYSSVSQPFLLRGTLTKFSRFSAAPLDGQIGIKIKELYLLAAPLAPAHGTLVCRGTPVGNH